MDSQMKKSESKSKSKYFYEDFPYNRAAVGRAAKKLGIEKRALKSENKAEAYQWKIYYTQQEYDLIIAYMKDNYKDGAAVKDCESCGKEIYSRNGSMCRKCRREYASKTVGQKISEYWQSVELSN